MKFTRSDSGIYYHDLENRQIVLVNQVKENELGYTKRELERAQLARKMYRMIGYPLINDFKIAIKNNLINNCPVTAEDVKNAEKIYGPSIAALQGKTTRTTPEEVKTDMIPVPPFIKEKYHNITLGIDIFFVNRQAFLSV